MGRVEDLAVEEEKSTTWMKKHELVLAQREKALRVTYKYIAEKAKEIIEDPCFKASRGW